MPKMAVRDGRIITKSIPAPIGGWNAKDMLSEMEPDEAWVLDNYIPGALGVEQRNGFAPFATGMTGNFIESLMEYNAAGSNPKLFAATPNDIWDASASGAVGSAEVTGLSNGRWQHTMFATAGGTFLVACNGQDDVRNYNGSAWSTPTINNVSSSTLISVTAHVQRLWFIQDGTLKVWYLDPLSIAGDATEINFASLCRLGGELVAMATWTHDGGAGMDDLAVFITSKGEVLIYQGTDPDSATTWALVGVFKGPEPIGRRCVIKLGADLCYLSSQGLIPVPQFLAQNSAGTDAVALTNKISGAFRSAFEDAGTFFGWQVIEYSKGGLLIVNVPVKERAKSYQYVMNLRTGKWCRFTNMNASCWGPKGNDIYFGGMDGKTYLYGGVGVHDDDGEVINALACQAFNNFGVVSTKSFKSARALLTGPAGYVPLMRVLLDFEDSLPSFSPTSFNEIGPPWDVSEWDVAAWGTAQSVNSQWRPITGTGVAGSLCLATAMTNPLRWNRTDVQFELGRTQ